MKTELKPATDPFKDQSFMVHVEKAQPLMVLEYLNSWGNEFLFVFLLMAGGFLLLLVNQLSASLPENVDTVLGIQVPAYWATTVPIFALIVVAVVLAVYYNMRRRYIENMMYFFYHKAAEQEIEKSKKAK